MSIEDRVAFIRHIAESPDELAPRLVFADWCIEQADSLPGEAGEVARARAEYIRVQCEMTHRDRLYPPVSPLLQRERELEAEYLSRWLAELPEWAESSDGFYRGFALDIRASAVDLFTGGSALADITPLNRIRLTASPPGSLLALVGCAWWANVRALRFEYRRQRIDHAELEAFCRQADLRRLVLLRTGEWGPQPPTVPAEILRERYGGDW